MTFDEYQKLAMRTRGPGQGQACAALGLAGEAGEFCDELKKMLYHGHPWQVELLAKELGDIMWYVALAAESFGMKMGEIAEQNIEKLKKRYPEGFSTERSINRKHEGCGVQMCAACHEDTHVPGAVYCERCIP